MNPRTDLIHAVLRLLPQREYTCLAAYAAAGPRPALWRPIASWRWHRRIAAAEWLCEVVARGLRGPRFAGATLEGCLYNRPGAPPTTACIKLSQEIRPKALQALLAHVDDHPTIDFDSFIPDNFTQPMKA